MTMKKQALLISLLALSLSAILFVSCKKDPVFKVQYSITCEECSICFKNNNQEVVCDEPVNSAWTYSFDANSGEKAEIVLTNLKTSGTISARVLVDGSVVKEGSNTGGQKAITVFYTIP